MATTNLGLKNDHAAGSTVSAAGYLNPVANYLEALFYGYPAIVHSDAASYDISVATGTGASRTAILPIGGTLGANRNLVVDTIAGAHWWVYNGTSGGFAVTVKTSAGTGVSVPNGARVLLVCDGTNIVSYGLGLGSGVTSTMLVGSTTWDPGSIADAAATSTTVTVTGAAVGDPAFASLSTLGANNVLISAHVQAADTVRVTIFNKTGSNFDATSGTVRACVMKS